jgi:hypothetical protein
MFRDIDKALFTLRKEMNLEQRTLRMVQGS